MPGSRPLERARTKLKRYRAAVLKAAVEGRLTAEWRATHPGVEPAAELLERILAERRRQWEGAQLAKVRRGRQDAAEELAREVREPRGPTRPSLSPLPQGWCWASFDQIARSDPGSDSRNGRSGTQRDAFPFYWVRMYRSSVATPT